VADNDELRAIFEADQDDRRSGRDWKVTVANDEVRLARTKELVLAGLVQTADDHYRAAFVFQHGPELDDIAHALEHARRAVELGHPRARWIAAAAEDRWLVRQDRPQKYGTQLHGVDGRWVMYEVDPAVTDEERAAMGVPTLADQLARAERMTAENPPSPHPPQVLEVDHEALERLGWWRSPIRIAPGPMLDRRDAPWRPMAARVGSVEQRGWYCQPPVDELPSAVQTFAAAMQRALGLDDSFNEITWQRHEPDVIGIGPHRDQSHYRGAIVIVTLQGSARFAILGDRSIDSVIEAWQTEPGDMVILRADGCPWHTVDAPVAGERITLTLRSTAEPHGWE
jgi:hypothetical protein